MQAQQREARKHPRHAVEGLTAIVNGVECAIIDLSVKAVRVVGRISDLHISGRDTGPIRLGIRRDADQRLVLEDSATTRLNRHCDVFVVISFDVDRAVMDELIAAHDSFRSTFLKEIF